MSVITDALQKAQSRPLADPPATPSTGRGPWWSAGTILVVVGLLWVWASHSHLPHRQIATSTPLPAPEPAPILSLLPGNPGSPALGWRVDGILTGMGTPLAIINGTTVAEGEQIAGGTKVVSVTHEAVELERNDGKRVTLAVASER